MVHMQRSTAAHHQVKRSSGNNTDDEDVDSYEIAIAKSGCAKENSALQDCFHDGGRDWRKCGNEMKAFKACMIKSSANRSQHNGKPQSLRNLQKPNTKRIMFLWEAAVLQATCCPTLSRFYIRQMLNVSQNTNVTLPSHIEQHICFGCGSILFLSGSSTTKLKGAKARKRRKKEDSSSTITRPSPTSSSFCSNTFFQPHSGSRSRHDLKIQMACGTCHSKHVFTAPNLRKKEKSEMMHKSVGSFIKKKKKSRKKGHHNILKKSSVKSSSIKPIKSEPSLLDFLSSTL